jgi:hypothetical protein
MAQTKTDQLIQLNVQVTRFFIMQFSPSSCSLHCFFILLAPPQRLFLFIPSRGIPSLSLSLTHARTHAHAHTHTHTHTHTKERGKAMVLYTLVYLGYEIELNDRKHSHNFNLLLILTNINMMLLSFANISILSRLQRIYGDETWTYNWFSLCLFLFGRTAGNQIRSNEYLFRLTLFITIEIFPLINNVGCCFTVTKCKHQLRNRHLSLRCYGK